MAKREKNEKKKERERENEKEKDREEEGGTKNYGCTCFLESPGGLEEPPESGRSPNRGGENERQ